MKKFRVGCNLTQHFTTIIEADSEEDALQKALELIAEESVPDDADIFDREYQSVHAEEI